MNALLIILGVIAIVGGVAVVFHSKKSKSVRGGVLGALVLILGLFGFLFGFSFKIIPTGYTGVRVSVGQVSGEVLLEGFNFKKPFVEHIKLISNKQRDKEVEAQIWGETSEKTPVYAKGVTVSYRVSSERSAWVLANISNPDDLVSQTIVASSVKSAMAELGAEEVTVRSKVEPLVREKLSQSVNEKYGNGTVEIVKVIIDQMDFEDGYNEAIAKRSIAKQIQTTQEIENNTAIAKAEADKKVAIANAEAKAEAIRIAAKAEAEANELLTNSLNDNIIKLKFYEKWNGVLPTVMGEGTVITDVGGN